MSEYQTEPSGKVTPEEWLRFYSDEQNPAKGLRVRDVKFAVCKYFNLLPSVLISDDRTLPLVRARQIGFYLAREKTTKSLPAIGREFGGRDHTTILHGVRQIAKLIREDWQLAYDLAHVEAML